MAQKLRHAGNELRWSGSTMPSLAIDAYPSWPLACRAEELSTNRHACEDEFKSTSLCGCLGMANYFVRLEVEGGEHRLYPSVQTIASGPFEQAAETAPSVKERNPWISVASPFANIFKYSFFLCNATCSRAPVGSNKGTIQ